MAMDEIDWAVRYGEDALWWADMPPNDVTTRTQLLPPDDHVEFDRWVVGTPGARRPRPRIARPVRDLLRALEQQRPQGWTGFSLELLDLPVEIRDEVTKAWARQTREADAGRHPTDVRWSGPLGGAGVSVFCDDRHNAFPDNIVRAYCMIRVEHHQASHWWGIVAARPRASGPRVCLIVRRDPRL